MKSHYKDAFKAGFDLVVNKAEAVTGVSMAVPNMTKAIYIALDTFAGYFVSEKQKTVCHLEDIREAHIDDISMLCELHTKDICEHFKYSNNQKALLEPIFSTACALMENKCYDQALPFLLLLTTVQDKFPTNGIFVNLQLIELFVRSNKMGLAQEWLEKTIKLLKNEKRDNELAANIINFARKFIGLNQFSFTAKLTKAAKKLFTLNSQSDTFAFQHLIFAVEAFQNQERKEVERHFKKYIDTSEGLGKLSKEWATFFNTLFTLFNKLVIFGKEKIEKEDDLALYLPLQDSNQNLLKLKISFKDVGTLDLSVCYDDPSLVQLLPISREPSQERDREEKARFSR